MGEKIVPRLRRVFEGEFETPREAKKAYLDLEKEMKARLGARFTGLLRQAEDIATALERIKGADRAKLTQEFKALGTQIREMHERYRGLLDGTKSAEAGTPVVAATHEGDRAEETISVDGREARVTAGASVEKMRKKVVSDDRPRVKRLGRNEKNISAQLKRVSGNVLANEEGEPAVASVETKGGRGRQDVQVARRKKEASRNFMDRGEVNEDISRIAFGGGAYEGLLDKDGLPHGKGRWNFEGGFFEVNLRVVYHIVREKK